MGRSRTGMPNDDGVGIHSFQVQDCVFEGFSFRSTAGLQVKVNNIRTQSFCGQFERTSCSCTGFKEEIDNGFSPECGDFFDFSRGYFIEGFCSIENGFDLSSSEVLDAEKMLV